MRERTQTTTGTDWPTTCAAVTYDMAGEGHGEPSYDADLGDLLWNPKGGYGHVLTHQARCNVSRKREPGEPIVDCCCGGWCGPCDSLVDICECGEDNSRRDHHYELLARKPK